MTTILWDAPANRLYTVGLDRGVFFPQNGVGVAWNGLTGLKETLEGGAQTYVYLDGKAVINRLDLGQFSGTLEAITYPEEFLPYDGYSKSMYSAQARASFNLSYRTFLGNGAKGTDHGYILHLVYNCMVKPADRENKTLTTESDLDTFSWDLTTTPVPIENGRPSAHFYIDSTQILPGVLAALENYIYGTDSTDPMFPTIDQLLGLFEENALYKIVDNGDGTWTATGPDEAFEFDETGTIFTLHWPWVEYFDIDTYKIKSF